MFTAIQQIAERRIEENLKSGCTPDLSHWKDKPLPLHDEMANVPPHLRMAYKILRNAGYVPEEIALQKEISRLEDLLKGCTDEKVKIQQMKKLDFLRVKLDTKMNKKLRFDSDSPYYAKVVDNISTRDK